MKKIAFFVFICLLSSLVFAQDKVVYHFDQAEVQALKGLRNIRNQLEAAPETKIIVVTMPWVLIS